MCMTHVNFFILLQQLLNFVFTKFSSYLIQKENAKYYSLSHGKKYCKDNVKCSSNSPTEKIVMKIM